MIDETAPQSQVEGHPSEEKASFRQTEISDFLSED